MVSLTGRALGFALICLQTVPCWGCTHRHLSLLLCLYAVRIGEAAHPGPLTYSLGALNATGLQGKHHVVAQLPPGLFAASETHLTSRGVTEFNRGLYHARSPFKLVPGAGDYTGVGFITSVPTRAACHSWHPDVYDAARLQVVNAFLSPLWVLAGVCYGFASGPPSRTLQLLEHLSERIVDGSVGPRVIAGDFNLLADANPLRLHWESAGFVEIQQLWASRFGLPLQPTCKRCTRKDFVYVSPELLPWIIDVTVQNDWFADHALLMATLQLPGAVPARPFWRMPRPRKLPADIARSIPGIDPARRQQLAQEKDPGRLYAEVWAEQEDLISHALISRGLAPLAPAERGRGCTTDVQVARNSTAPVRKARHGEVEPLYFGLNKRYANWFRQLRRLQSLVQASQKGSSSSCAVMHRAATWNAIRASPGFLPSFSAWWPTRAHRLHHAPLCLPQGLPGLATLQAIYQCFEVNFRAFERELLSHRKRLARIRRQRLPSLIFADIQHARSCPVSSC